MKDHETKLEQTCGALIAMALTVAVLPIIGLWAAAAWGVRAWHEVAGAFAELGRDFKLMMKGEG